jgi:DNA-binding transcriptional LysR family regulator
VFKPVIQQAFRQMELRQLRYFLGVADFKSFSRAAIAVRVAQPALSRQVRKLEEEIGVALFYRDGRGAILTEHGERYYRKVCNILRQLDQAVADLQTDSEVPTGEVTLGVPAQLGPRFVSQIIHSFRDRYPSARIRVAEACSHQIAEWLQSSRVDVGFVYDAHTYRNLPTKVVVEEALYLVGPHASRHTAGKSVPFRQVAKLPLLLPNLGSTLCQRVEGAALQLGVQAKYELSIDSLASIKQLVIDGVGYTILPYAAVYDEVQRAQLSVARIVEPDFYRPLALAVRPNGALSVATGKLLDLIQLDLDDFLAKANWMGRVTAKNPLKSALMSPAPERFERQPRV